LGSSRTSSLNPPCKSFLGDLRDLIQEVNTLSRKKKMAREHLNLLLLLLSVNEEGGVVLVDCLVGDVVGGGGLRFVS